MDELLGSPIPPETGATCRTCAMCSTGGSARGRGYFFRRDVKCCSYQPALPNFLVGGVLLDGGGGQSPGGAGVEARITAGVAVSPLGLGQPPAYRALYEGSPPEAFGRSRALRCPHFLDDGVGHCGIWRHRPAACSTWYCKHVRGATGERFWRSLQRLLQALETTLARWCVRELGLDDRALREFSPQPTASGGTSSICACALDGLPGAAGSRTAWGTWRGREAEFYRRTAQLVRGLAWSQVTAIGGPEVSVHARAAREAHRALTTRLLPGRLVAGDCRVTVAGPGFLHLVTYSEHDPLRAPRVLLDVLDAFDGKPTREAVRLVRSHGVNLDQRLLGRLIDHGILVPQDEPPSGGARPPASAGRGRRAQATGPRCCT